jgi:hypothetical protein
MEANERSYHFFAILEKLEYIFNNNRFLQYVFNNYTYKLVKLRRRTLITQNSLFCK